MQCIKKERVAARKHGLHKEEHIKPKEVEGKGVDCKERRKRWEPDVMSNESIH